jgi:hypothetical protein
MAKVKTLEAFSRLELSTAHKLLASRVASMMGRKLEEGDWSAVYCNAKGIPIAGWSNLNIDVLHGNLGVEHKMLCVKSDKKIKELCGTRLMHPALTRSIRIPEGETDATKAARIVLKQYADTVAKRQKAIRESSGKKADLRTGWLLWQEALREFLYFEESTVAPIPKDYTAIWKESGGGARKASKNLWVYHKDSDEKRYSITTSAGAKIQPYFRVPGPTDPNLYYFVAQGEHVNAGFVRIWITPNTAALLRHKLKTTDNQVISDTIIKVSKLRIKSTAKGNGPAIVKFEDAESLVISEQAYEMLRTNFNGVSDEHSMQLFLRSSEESA